VVPDVYGAFDSVLSCGAGAENDSVANSRFKNAKVDIGDVCNSIMLLIEGQVCDQLKMAERGPTRGEYFAVRSRNFLDEKV
jgi:hypothetical protein